LPRNFSFIYIARGIFIRACVVLQGFYIFFSGFTKVDFFIFK